MITVYSKEGCPFCDKIKSTLTEYRITHEVLDLDVDYTREDVVTKLSASLNKDVDKFTYPVIFDQSLYVGGCDDMLDYMLEMKMV